VSPRLEAALSAAWVVVLLVGGATVLLKSVGPVLLGGREVPASLAGFVGLLAPALLAALVVTQVAGAGERELVADARLVGLGVAVVALLLRAPLLLVVVAAAAGTALTRALG
jgi:branched-subunit amino acid transport protein